jgi:predicted HTH domain antitoxin
MVGTVTLEFSNELLKSLNMTPAEFDHEARFFVAAKFFELGKLTSGQAAKICGMKRVEFLTALKGIGVSAINLSRKDLEEDFKFARS